MNKKQWWKESYVNTRDWILDKYEIFNLSPQEGILVLIIDFLNAKNIPISLEVLAEKSCMSLELCDKALNMLCAKKYLIIQVKESHIEFDLSGLYSADCEKPMDVFNQSIFDLYESEFARPLTKSESQRLSEWITSYDEKLIVYALREAIMYKKISFNYISKILADWEKKGITVESFEQKIEGE